MNWADKLKVAILEGNAQKAYDLIIEVPADSFGDVEEMLVASELIAQGIEMLEKDKEALQKQMLQIKLAKKFLE